MNNFKIYAWLAWDWMKEHWWFFYAALLIGIVNVGYWESEETGDNVSLIIAGLHVLALAYIIIRYFFWEIIISMKIKRLNRKMKRDWIERRDWIEKRNKRLMAKYLDGEPITANRS